MNIYNTGNITHGNPSSGHIAKRVYLDSDTFRAGIHVSNLALLGGKSLETEDEL